LEEVHGSDENGDRFSSRGLSIYGDDERQAMALKVIGGLPSLEARV